MIISILTFLALQFFSKAINFNLPGSLPKPLLILHLSRDSYLLIQLLINK